MKQCLLTICKDKSTYCSQSNIRSFGVPLFVLNKSQLYYQDITNVRSYIISIARNVTDILKDVFSFNIHPNRHRLPFPGYWGR